MDTNAYFGQLITRLINRSDLSEPEAYQAFSMVLGNEVSEMQQGAFLAALTAKGESEAEVAGGWRAVYELDTSKVALPCRDELVDNCGTGMDSFKTFNISTAASIVAAAGGVKVARHGARAITSVCGTVDMAETLGVDVECPVELVANSIEACGLGLFNGMSPAVHPMALGRILSQIRFGSPLNIAASLANPALPASGVRGVYAREMLAPVTAVMQNIGYRHGVVLYGAIDGEDRGMDEASVCGPTHVSRFEGGTVSTFTVEPESCGLRRHRPDELQATGDRHHEAVQMVSLLAGQRVGARRDAVLLNCAFIFLVRNICTHLTEGIALASGLIDNGQALHQLEQWVRHQNRTPEKGLDRLDRIKAEALQ